MPPGMTDDGLRAAVEARASQPDLGILMLSAYVELSYADVLLSDGRGRVGYLLKDRVTSLDTLVDALRTISAGGTVLDPEVVAQLLVARRRTDPLGALSPREREVLALMAEGRSNAAIAERLVITGGAVEKHISNIFAKINLPDVGSDNRRVLAVLAWLRAADLSALVLRHRRDNSVARRYCGGHGHGAHRARGRRSGRQDQQPRPGLFLRARGDQA